MDVGLQLRRMIDVARLVSGLGLEARRDGVDVKIRCPWHAERSGSCNLKDAPDGTVAAHCFGCGKNGNALHVIAAVRGWNMMGDFPRVLEEAAIIAGVRLEDLRDSAPASGSRRPVPTPVPTPVPVELPRLPREELKALWDATSPVDATGDCSEEDLAVARFLARRRWWPQTIARLGICRVLPLEHAWPSWWPGRWARDWRLAVLAYDSSGRPAAIHARSVTEAMPKTRWPMGCDGKYSFSRLLFADMGARVLLRGESMGGCEAVVIVEGMTDFLAASAAVLEEARPWAVLGATSGGFAALADVRWPKDLPAIIATDDDKAGERYAKEIAAALPCVRLRRHIVRSVEASAA